MILDISAHSHLLKAATDGLTASAPWQFLAALSVIFGIIAILAKPVALILGWWRKRRSARMSASLQAKTNVESFTDTEISQAVLHYIEPHASNVDPANEDDIRDFAFVREAVFLALDRALQSQDKVHLMVLADSGMGKTTLLLNFYAREQERPRKRRREIAIVPLGRPDAVAQIKVVKDKRSTILLLDALDEDTLAIANHESRLHDLLEASADFKAVIVSCRTQFFSSDQALPTATGIARVAPKRAGSPGTHHFKRIYLLPFSTEQVESYIQRTIPFYRFKTRNRARALVKRIPELAVRPMLLALLPDLLAREQHFREVWDLYAFMVDSWLSRESHWIEPTELLRVSEKVAVEVYLGRRSRQSERLRIEELSELLHQSSSDIETWKLTARSLLNRDASGSYKFAHRSIMEFLFIRALVGGENRCTQVQWTDMMCSLFLSWGRSTAATRTQAQLRAEELLEGEGLSNTGLFPLIDTFEPASRIDLQWALRALGKSNQLRERAGIPILWRRWTSRQIKREEVVRLYEFSEGIVWQLVITRDMSEKDIYRVPRMAGRYTDRAGKSWERPTLAEFRSLVETLLAHDSRLLDPEDLYWLSDADAQALSMARLRDTTAEPEAPAGFRNGAKLIASTLVGSHGEMSLDVYSLPKIARQAAGQALLAVPIAIDVATLRGDAQKQWAADRGEEVGTQSWGLSPVGLQLSPPRSTEPH